MSISTINGVSIESDRMIYSIMNSFVTFADGSTYDIETGAYQSAGPGYLKINGRLVRPTTANDNQAREESTSVTETAAEGHTFPARHLSLRLSALSATIVAEDRPDIMVDLKGTAVMIEMVKMKMASDTLKITEGRPRGGKAYFRSGGANITVVSGGGIVSTSGGRSGIFNKGPKDSLDITIRVPFGAPIDAQTDSIGKITITDVKGRLDLTTSGSGSIRATGVSGDVNATATSIGGIEITRGVIRNLVATTGGSGGIKVAECPIGNAFATVSSIGGITITGGNVGHLQAATSGIGNIVLKGTAHSAVLNASSIGSIEVDRVMTPPTQKRSSIGSIKIGRIG